MSYTHFSTEERESILIFILQGKSNITIARILKRDKSSIGREINRNGGRAKYRPFAATNRYKAARTNCRPNHRLISFDRMDDLLSGLQKTWSPEQTVNRLKLNISVSTIYRGLNNGILPSNTKGFLRRKGKPYSKYGTEKRGKLSDKSIIDRPYIVNERSRLGDWESDTIVGKDHKTCLAVCLERKTGLGLAKSLPNRKADSVAAAIISEIGKFACSTITVDNGKEFAEFLKIEHKLNTEVYFCNPHSPWERAANENFNGLLREFFPKGTDFSKVSQESVDQAIFLLNTRPRRRLNWLTPLEAFLSEYRCT